MAFLQVGDRRVSLSVAPQRDRIVYRFKTRPPGVSLIIKVKIEMQIAPRPWRPYVFVDAPDCQRHRYAGGSLCMWWERDTNAQRWVMADGLPALVHYIEIHLYQEACCRAGEPWPGEEAPGAHPRPRSCETCGGFGP